MKKLTILLLFFLFSCEKEVKTGVLEIDSYYFRTFYPSTTQRKVFTDDGIVCIYRNVNINLEKTLVFDNTEIIKINSKSISPDLTYSLNELGNVKINLPYGIYGVSLISKKAKNGNMLTIGIRQDYIHETFKLD